jgi:cytidylate kinase
MENNSTFAITINRQLGSGGAYVGQALAKKLDIFYADREIISQAAKKFSMLEEDLEEREEKISSFWQSFFQSYTFGAPEIYIPRQAYIPTDRELFEIENQVIERIAKERSAVIIGRCGCHILHEYPGLVRICLHADLSFRINRVCRKNNVSEEEAVRMIAQSDKERPFYYHTFTGKEWSDARQYDLSINTSKIGLDKSVDLIVKYLENI